MKHVEIKTLNVIRPINDTEDLILSIAKIYETLLEQTLRKAEEILEIKIAKPRETFHFNPPIQIEGSWMIELTSLEVYIFIFSINTTFIKIELYADNFDEIPFEEIKVELEEIPNISDTTPYHLQHEKIGLCIIGSYKKLWSEESSTDGYIILLFGYARSPFRVFESYLRSVVGLDEDDIQLFSKQSNSFFVTDELSSGIYTIKIISKAVYTKGDHE